MTLLGPGGSGKTRLALEVARQVAHRHPDGVMLLELAGLSSADLLEAWMARLLELEDKPGIEPSNTIEVWLAKRELLLVLDNCEHLCPVLGTLIRRWLERARALTVLATSRQPLGVAGELEMRIAPLPVPGAPERSARSLERNPSVRLFVERASLRRRGYRLTSESAPFVAEICRRLDGVPLALELAAPWLSALTEQELLSRLEARLDLLGMTGAEPERHRSLRAAFDWSYELLGPVERAIFARASVFRGGFTAEAARAVCGHEEGENRDVLSVLKRLIDDSLVVPVAASPAVTRYSMLETVREYAWERVSPTGQRVVQRAHARYFLRFAQGAMRELDGPLHIEALDRFEADRDNLRAALEWATKADPALALRLGGTQVRFWEARGPLDEARRWLSTVIEAAPEPTRPRAAVQLALSAIEWKRGQFDAALGLAEQALTLAHQLGDSSTVIRAKQQLSTVLHSVGELERSIQMAEEALALGRPHANPSQVFDLVWAVGIGRYFAGDLKAAEASFHELEQIALATDEPWHRAISQRLVGLVALDRGQFARAKDLLGMSLQQRWRLRDHVAVSYGLDDHALLALGASQLERGFRLAGAAAEIRELQGAQAVLPWRSKMATVLEAARRGRRSQAAAWFTEGRRMDVGHAVAYALGSQAYVARTDAEPAELTRREFEIAKLVSHGLTNRAIAARLGISERTVESHVEHVREKLQMRNRAEIAAWAVTQRSNAIP